MTLPPPMFRGKGRIGLDDGSTRPCLTRCRTSHRAGRLGRPHARGRLTAFRHIQGHSAHGSTNPNRALPGALLYRRLVTPMASVQKAHTPPQPLGTQPDGACFGESTRKVTPSRTLPCLLSVQPDGLGLTLAPLSQSRMTFDRSAPNLTAHTGHGPDLSDRSQPRPAPPRFHPERSRVTLAPLSQSRMTPDLSAPNLTAHFTGHAPDLSDQSQSRPARPASIPEAHGWLERLYHGPASHSDLSAPNLTAHVLANDAKRSDQPRPRPAPLPSPKPAG